MIGGNGGRAVYFVWHAGNAFYNLGELGHFKIIKEEASSAGVRRIKAILE